MGRRFSTSLRFSFLRRAIGVAAACWLLAPAALAACLDPGLARPTVGLVLGGGGARGSAHIGVIRVLEEMHIPVDCVAGTSIGSLVGALYASGMTADELERVMVTADWDDLFVDDTDREDQPFRRKRDDDLALFGPKMGVGAKGALIRSGAISGQKMSFLFESLVTERVQVESFDDLPIPYRAVAADISNGQRVVMGHGDVAVAMRSSMSVPGVFNPVEWNGHLLVDGGIADNVPVDVVREMGADVVIVVNVGSGLARREDIESALDIVSQLTAILIENNAAEQIASLTPRDVLITPPLGDRVSAADFSKSALGIEIGYQAADQARELLQPLSVGAAEYQRYRQRITGRLTPDPVIQFVRIDNASRFDDSVIAERLAIEPGSALDVESLNRSIRDVYALGFLDLVRYEVVEENSQAGIVVHVGQDTRGTQLLEWGLDYSGDGDANYVNLRVGYLNTAVDAFGSELRVVGQVGESPGMFAYLYKYLNPELKIYLEPHLFAEQQDLLNYDDDGHALTSTEVTRYGGSVALGREFGTLAAASAGVRLYSGNVDIGIGPPDTEDFEFDAGEAFAAFSYDRMDDRYFPGQGGFLRFEYIHSSSTLGADDPYEQLVIDGFLARTHGRHGFVGAVRYYETLDHTAPIYAQFRAGGFARMSGFHENELVGQDFAMVLGGYRYRFAGGGLLPAYVGGTVEYGEMAEESGDLFDHGILNGSVYLGYRSPIGPLYVGAGFAEAGRQTYFLRVGNVFGASTVGR